MFCVRGGERVVGGGRKTRNRWTKRSSQCHQRDAERGLDSSSSVGHTASFVRKTRTESQFFKGAFGNVAIQDKKGILDIQ